MERKLDAVKVKYTDALNRKKRIQEEIIKLESTKEVKDYLLLKEYMKSCDRVIKQIEDDYIIEKMCNCNHIFVCGNPESLLGNERVYHCLKCGVTNLYKEKLGDGQITDFESRVCEVYDKTAINGLVLNIETNDVNLYKGKLKELEREKPYDTDISKGFELELFYREQLEKQNTKVRGV